MFFLPVEAEIPVKHTQSVSTKHCLNFDLIFLKLKIQNHVTQQYLKLYNNLATQKCEQFFIYFTTVNSYGGP